MKARFREMTAKYKAIRLQPSALFLSRSTQTFFNKFTKKGKKALARRHVHQALIQLRFNLRRPAMHMALLRMFRRLRIQFLLVLRRKGRKLHDVPVPVRRNKQDILSIQILYAAVRRRTNLELSHRISSELISVILDSNNSAPIKYKSALYTRMFEARVDLDRR